MDYQKAGKSIGRRGFLYSAAAAGAGVALSPMVWGQTDADKADHINVALLGVGEQGQVLMSACLKIPGIRIKAVCDIWEAYNQKRGSRMLGKFRHEHNTYVDHKEMLDKEKYLDAVIIATPDFWHAEHAVDCHQMHLENFFDAVYSGGKVALTCPAEIGYETAVAVLKVNEAAEAGRKLEFQPDEFAV